MTTSKFIKVLEGTELKNVMLIVAGESLNTSISRTSLVISSYSAATFNALALGRSVMLYILKEEDRLSLWFRELHVPKPNSIDQLISEVRGYNFERPLGLTNEVSSLLEKT